MRTELQCDAQSLHSDRWLSLRQAAMQSTRGEHILHKPAQNQIKNTVKFKNTWVTGLIVSVMVVELGLDCSQSSVDCTCTEMSGVSAGKKAGFHARLQRKQRTCPPHAASMRTWPYLPHVVSMRT